MKPIPRPKIHSGLFLLFLFTCTVQFISCSEWVMPKSLVGTWSATQDVTVRFQSGIASFRFAKASVQIAMNIQDDGTVKGSIGGANLEGCSVSQNRGWFGRTFNLNTDYIIAGRLTGSIFEQDTLTEKEFSLPFDMKADTVAGTIFQKQGTGVFPMVNIHLTK
jgi:hypothetical protein